MCSSDLMEGNKLAVAMVNPDDKSVINEIVFFTGLNPEVKIITYLEFENFMKYGKPSKDENEWEAYTKENKNVKVFC